MALVKLNNRGVRSVTDFGGTTSLGSYTFIKKLTASSSATLSFVDGTSDVVLDNTYKEYLFTFNNIHPASDSLLTFQTSTDGGSSYGVTATSTFFYAYHNEAGSDAGVGYHASRDLAQSTSFQALTGDNMDSGGADSSASGYLYLFDPSSTTFVKHFIANTNHVETTPYTENNFNAGYFNTTSAIDAIQFKMSSGNIDAGDICLYGIA